MAEKGRLPAIISNIKIEVLPKVSDLAGNFTRLWIILSLLVVSFLVLPPQVAHADPAGVTVQRYYSTWEAEWTTTSTSYVDVEPSTGYYPLQLTFTPPVTADYLLIACFTVSNSSTSGTTSAQLLQNTAQIYYREWTPTAVGDWVTSGYTSVLSLTGNTPYTFKIQLKTSNASDTAKIRDCSIILFKITNYYSSSDDITRTFNTDAYQDGLSLSIPSAASGDYLVLASTSVSSDSNNKRLYCNWLRGSTSQAEIVREFKTADQRRGWLMMRIMTFTATAETLKLQFKVETKSTCSVYKQRIVAVKLSDLGIDYNSIESEDPSSTTSTSYQTKVTYTITPSPAKPGDYLVMGFAMLNGSSTGPGDEPYASLDIDSGAYQAERNFRPDDTLDYVPLYAFKKYRMLSGSHTIKIQYKSSNTSITSTIKNARILAIKVNTLQSYEDSAVTTRTVFDSSHHTIYVYGYAYEYKWTPAPGAPMPYKVVYYDGGTSHNGGNGAKVCTDTVNSNYNRSIFSTLDFNGYPASSYGTWHAVVYRADTGDPQPADTYTANDSNSIMEIGFTVQQDAISNNPPSMTYVKLYNSGGSAEVTAMTPQTAYDVKVKVADTDGKADLTTIVVKIWYDANGGTPTEGEFTAAAANTQTCAIITWTESGGTFAIQPAASTTWALGSCIAPADLTGEFQFKFTVGKVATETTGSANWQIAAKVTDDSSQTAFGYDGDTATNGMNWYGEITVGNSTVNWGTVALGSDFSANSKTGISVTYICNGNYTQQAKSSSLWSGGGNSVTLNPAGSPGNGEFSLKADDTAVLGSAALVTTGYVPIDTGTQTGEGGNPESAYTVWLKLGASGMPAVQYSGTIYYGIAQ